MFAPCTTTTSRCSIKHGKKTHWLWWTTSSSSNNRTCGSLRRSAEWTEQQCTLRKELKRKANIVALSSQKASCSEWRKIIFWTRPGREREGQRTSTKEARFLRDNCRKAVRQKRQGKNIWKRRSSVFQGLSNHSPAKEEKLHQSSTKRKGKVQRTSWWMPKVTQRLWCIHPCPKLVDGTVSHSNSDLLDNLMGEKEPWVVDRNSKTEIHSLVTEHLERHSASSDQHVKKIDVTSWRSSRDDAMLQATPFCWSLLAAMNIQGDPHRGENPRCDNSQNSRPRTLCEELCAYRRCNQNPVNMYIKTGFFTHSCRIKIGLESDFDEQGKGFREIRWMSPEIQSSLLNTFPPHMIATILKALREQLRENDQLNAVEEIAGQYQKSLLSTIKSWKMDEDSWTMWIEDICQKISWSLPDVKKLHEYILKVTTKLLPMHESKNAGKKLLDLIWVDTDKSVDPDPHSQGSSIETVCQGIQDEETRQNSKSFTCSCVVLCNATSWSCESACHNHDVCWLVEWMETVEVETLRHQQSAFPKGQPEDSYVSVFQQKIDRNMVKTKLADWSRGCTELKTLFTSGNLTTWTWSLKNWEDSDEANSATVPPFKPGCEDGSAQWWLCVFRWTQSHRHTAQISRLQRKTWDTLGFEDSDAKRLLLLNRGV